MPVSFNVSHHTWDTCEILTSVETAGLREVRLASDTKSIHKVERFPHRRPSLDGQASGKGTGVPRWRVTPRYQPIHKPETWLASTHCRRRDVLRWVRHAKAAIKGVAFPASTVASAQHVALHNPSFHSGTPLKTREIKTILNACVTTQRQMHFHCHQSSGSLPGAVMANTSLNRTLCGGPSLGFKSVAQTRPTAKCRLARTLGVTGTSCSVITHG